MSDEEREKKDAIQKLFLVAGYLGRVVALSGGRIGVIGQPLDRPPFVCKKFGTLAEIQLTAFDPSSVDFEESTTFAVQLLQDLIESRIPRSLEQKKRFAAALRELATLIDEQEIIAA